MGHMWLFRVAKLTDMRLQMFSLFLAFTRASLVAQRLKRLPMRETWIQSLGREDPLEKELATHTSILAWRIPWTEKPGGLQPMGSQRVGLYWATSLSWLLSHFRASSFCYLGLPAFDLLFTKPNSLHGYQSDNSNTHHDFKNSSENNDLNELESDQNQAEAGGSKTLKEVVTDEFYPEGGLQWGS